MLRSLLGRSAFLVSTLLISGASAFAQNSGAVFPESRVIAIAQKLEAKLKSGTEPSGMLEEKLDETTRVAVRIKSGRAEFHRNAEDVFFILSGEATLVSGGAVLHPKGDEEVRGDSVEGGAHTPMYRGDVVHVQSATAHQVLIQNGTTLCYVVIKIPHPQ